jgi:rhodanese-related sulfurtransferase
MEKERLKAMEMQAINERTNFAVRAAREIPCVGVLLGVSGAFALLVNVFHPMGLPVWAGPVKPPGMPQWILTRLQRIDVRGGYQRATAAGALLVDVRDEKDFREGHAPGAIPLPYHGFGRAYPEFARRVGKGSELLLYCYGTGCNLGARVGKRLIVRGFQHVTILQGGFQAWKRAGLPVGDGPESRTGRQGV